MGVAASLTATPARGQALGQAPAPARTGPRAEAARPALRLVQRSCDCGEPAGLSGACEGCDHTSLRRSRLGGGHAEASPLAPPIVEAALASEGEPLDAEQRRRLEPLLGHDISHVRIHTGPLADASARAVGATAYTVGQDIVFRAGQFRPGNPAGDRLLVHELTHTVQQARALPSPALRVGPSNDVHERAAVAAARMLAPPAAAAARLQERAVQRADGDAPATEEESPGYIAGKVLGYAAGLANAIPGFRMLTIVIGVNPITGQAADRSPANILRALVEFMPGGALIVQALDSSGIFDKMAAWAVTKIAALATIGGELKQALRSFIASLGLSDIADLGGVWERAKRIFTEPIDHLIDFAKGLVTEILQAIKDAILMPLAKLAADTKGWDLLIAVLGKNPITGEVVVPSAENLIGGFLKLIGQDEILDNMKKSNALPRAWAWFQGALSAVVGFVSQVPTLFLAALKALTIEDVVLIAGAFRKVAGVFGGFLENFITWAGTAVWNLLEIIFDVVSPGALAYVKKTGEALKSILKNPLPFVGNLVKAAKLGFSNFASNFGAHLKTGLIEWLTGTLTGVYIPTAFTLGEIGKFVMSILGITWTQIRGMIVEALGPSGETIMKGLETTFDVVVALVTGGPAAAWEVIKDKLTNLKDMVIEAIEGFVIDTIVKKAVPKLISLFVPGAGFISAILSIYETVMVFVDKIATIAAAVKAFVDSIVAIANGQIEGAAAKVESTLAGVLSLAISLLAGFLSLGGIAAKVKTAIEKLRGMVFKALKTAVNWVVSKAKQLFKSLFGKEGKPDERTDAQKSADLAKGVGEADALLADDKLTSEAVAKRLPAIQSKYRLTRLALVTDAKTGNSETDHIEGEVNPKLKANPHKKAAKDEKTNITVKRSSFTAVTKWNLMVDNPDEHKALVQGKPRLRKNIDRRHVISSQTMAAHYETVLNRELWSKAKAILVGKGTGVDDPLGNPTIQSAAQARHSQFFNDEKNLFLGDASENRSIGAETDIPEDWEQREWKKHFNYIKKNYALSDEFSA